MFVSIIIPTYRDWSRLALCLKSLADQTIKPDKYEIIVVNNDPTDHVPKELEVPTNCIIISESKPGSYAARNTALKISRGEIIGFTDSDCIPKNNWIENAILQLINNPEYSRIAGKIELFFKNKKLTTAESYDKIYAFRQEIAATEGVSVTGNMFTYKFVFDKIGLFDESLMSGGDYEWSRRAQNENFKIAFGNDVIILHPARYSVAELIKKEKRVAGWIGKRKLKALQRLVKYILPPVNTLLHGKDMAVSERLAVFKLKYHLNVTRTIEEIKISFGKRASRE